MHTLYRLTSLSRDACKLYGDITPGDVTHSNVTLLYENHFKGTHRNMPKKLGKNTSEEKYEVWEKSAEVVQVKLFPFTIIVGYFVAFNLYF